MKKVILLLVLTFFFTGCVNVNKSTYDEIISIGLTKNKVTLKNKTSQGFSYYLPKGVMVLEDTNSNLILKSEKYTMYLYIDLISYFNKIKEQYNESNKAFYSKKIDINDKFGYLEINLYEKDKYLIEIMYNYAKIEVIVDSRDIKEMLSYAVSLLNSISYNDKIIENMIGEDILNYNENEYNIFETVSSESNLIMSNENANNDNKNDEVPDTDLIN